MLDIDSEANGVNVLIDFNQKISVVRVIGNIITPATLAIKAEVLPAVDAMDIDFDIAFAKIKFWFETIVSRTIMFSRNNMMALDMFTDSDGNARVINQLMITPHQPTDEHLGALFQAKMTALSEGKMNFGVVRVNSESQSGLVWSYVGEWHDDLPDMEQWFAQKPYYFDSPWWTRPDSSTIDMITKGTTNFETIPNWAFRMDFIESAIRPHDIDQPSESAVPEPDNVVLRGRFRPTVIDGGSDE